MSDLESNEANGRLPEAAAPSLQPKGLPSESRDGSSKPIALGGFSSIPDPNRRQINFMMPIAIAGAVAGAIGAGAGVLNYIEGHNARELGNNREKIREEEGRQRKITEYRDEISYILFGDTRADRHYIPGADNPYSGVKGITPHVKFAYASILLHLGFTAETIRPVEDLRVVRINGSLLLLGGPVPNVLTKWIMGIGRGSPVLGGVRNSSANLPVYFRNVFPSAPVLDRRPNYEIVTAHNTRHNWIDSNDDCLLLTSLPNIFSDGYGAFNHRIFIAAGLHGPGMRAAHFFLEQPSYLEEIIKKIKEYQLGQQQGWQALIRVTDVNTSTSMPGKLGEIGFFPIRDVNFDNVRKKFENTPLDIDLNNELIAAR